MLLFAYVAMPLMVLPVRLPASYVELKCLNIRTPFSILLCETVELGLSYGGNNTGFWLDWNVYTCLTQLYDGRDMYIIYYIKNNYTFRHFSLATFRLINKET